MKRKSSPVHEGFMNILHIFGLKMRLSWTPYQQIYTLSPTFPMVGPRIYILKRLVFCALGVYNIKGKNRFLLLLHKIKRLGADLYQHTAYIGLCGNRFNGKSALASVKSLGFGNSKKGDIYD
jgi:hypothetical protein